MSCISTKRAVVTGAAGFAGYSLTTHLLQHGYEVFAICRPQSSHNKRLEPANIIHTLEYDAKKGSIAADKNILNESEIISNLHVIELDSSNYSRIADYVDADIDYFFHLTWSGGRDEFDNQFSNVNEAISTIESASKLKCKKYICTGSQAEYGVQSELITEDLMTKPIYAYGSAKIAAMYLTKIRAEQLGIEWTWGRIFSLYGLYEPSGRMLPDLIKKLRDGEIATLSDCSQNWDYLDAGDAAEAIIALGERGHSGEIYNIANGDYHKLMDFVKVIEENYSNGGTVVYGDKANPYISLSPSVEKIKRDTGWNPKVKFLQDYESIRGLE